MVFKAMCFRVVGRDNFDLSRHAGGFLNEFWRETVESPPSALGGAPLENRAMARCQRFSVARPEEAVSRVLLRYGGAWKGGARWVGTVTKHDSQCRWGSPLPRCVSLHGASGAGHTLLDSALLSRNECENSAMCAFNGDASVVHTAIASGPPRRHHSPFPHRCRPRPPHVPTGCVPLLSVWISTRCLPAVPKSRTQAG